MGKYEFIKDCEYYDTDPDYDRFGALPIPKRLEVLKKCYKKCTNKRTKKILEYRISILTIREDLFK